jgi:hypothetical protein
VVNYSISCSACSMCPSPCDAMAVVAGRGAAARANRTALTPPRTGEPLAQRYKRGRCGSAIAMGPHNAEYTSMHVMSRTDAPAMGCLSTSPDARSRGSCSSSCVSQRTDEQSHLTNSNGTHPLVPCSTVPLRPIAGSVGPSLHGKHSEAGAHALTSRAFSDRRKRGGKFAGCSGV